MALILQLAVAVVFAIRTSARAAAIAFALAVCSQTALLYVSRPFGLRVSRYLNGWIALLAVIAGVIAALASGWASGLVLIAGSALILRLMQAWSYQRSGALTPFWLGLAGLLVEGFTISYIQKAPFAIGQ